MSLKRTLLSGRWHLSGRVTEKKRSLFLQASKAALHSMCDTLEMELNPFGISVIEVWAGTMKTDINAKVADRLERYQISLSYSSKNFHCRRTKCTGFTHKVEAIWFLFLTLQMQSVARQMPNLDSNKELEMQRLAGFVVPAFVFWVPFLPASLNRI